MPITIHHLSNQAGCDDVFALYRKDAGTLGFMPRGAFEEGITKGTLLVATDEHDEILGYLLYRLARGYASIAHLCVATTARGGGIGNSLVNELKRITTHLDGIKLKCRRDFDAHRQWPKWGFIARDKSIGRGADNAELVIWHLDHHPADLLSSLPLQKTLVAIDANIFFDLFWPDRPKREITGALLEPWIDDIVELGLTSEIFNDIDRCKDPVLRDTSKTKATTYHLIRAAVTKVDPVDAQLRKFYPATGSLSDQDISDIRHVAHAIVAGVKYFVTRDEKLLAKAPEILETFDLQLLSPVEFVSRLDSIEREQEYQPSRLGASSIVTKRLESHEISRFRRPCTDTSDSSGNYAEPRLAPRSGGLRSAVANGASMNSERKHFSIGSSLAWAIGNGNAGDIAKGKSPLFVPSHSLLRLSKKSTAMEPTPSHHPTSRSFSQLRELHQKLTWLHHKDFALGEISDISRHNARKTRMPSQEVTPYLEA